MRQLAQRVAVDYLLTPLNREQTVEYIRHRLDIADPGRDDIFTIDACDAIYTASGGVPRVINLLCDTALAYGYADQALTIDSTTIFEVLADKQREAAG
jgi:type II secretory pathway predicted ATPase ExeA